MKKLLSVVLFAVTLCSMSAGFSVMAQATETSSVNSADIGKNKSSGDYNYVLLNDGTVEITYYRGNETNLSIPSTIDGYTVTSLGVHSFNNGNFESVTIPDTITKLDYGVFSNCSNLTDITLPDSITAMSDSVFSDTAYFNDKKNWEGDLLYVGNYLVEAEPSISGECVIKDGTTMISAHIPTVYNLEDAPALTSLTIPSSVKYINKDSFVLCSRIEKINIENNKYFHLVDGVMFETNDNTLIKYPSLSENSSYTIPDGTTSIGASAFMYSSNLTSIAIPNSVKRIDDYAFNWCESLTDIAIPDSVTSIGGHAFSKCRGLTNIAIPDSVTLIDEGAFSYCRNLTTVVIPESITSISMYAFTECSNLPNITIPDSVTSIGEEAFGGCLSFTDITLPKSITSISEGLFSYCFKLKSINIPEGVTSIGESAFEGCEELTEITIPESVTAIEAHTFTECSSLENITIPKSVTSIDNWAFDECESLSKITIMNPDCEISALDGLGQPEKIYGYKGSDAESYAEENDIKFVPISAVNEIGYAVPQIIAVAFGVLGIIGVILLIVHIKKA